jgi:hypothetical protein
VERASGEAPSLGTLTKVVIGSQKQGISLHGGSVKGSWRGGFFSGGSGGYEKKALGMDRGSVGQTVWNPSTAGFEIWLRGTQAVQCLSLW